MIICNAFRDLLGIELHVLDQYILVHGQGTIYDNGVYLRIGKEAYRTCHFVVYYTIHKLRFTERR